MRIHDAAMQSLPVLAALLSQMYNIKVKVGGAQAYTRYDKDSDPPYIINLPGRVVEDMPAYLRTLHGYIDHEVGHVRFTDNDMVSSAFDASMKHNTGKKKLCFLEHTLWNILEDTYVEKRMGETFPGSMQNLEQLVRVKFGNVQMTDIRDEWIHSPSGNVNEKFGWEMLKGYILYKQRTFMYPFLAPSLAIYRNILDQIDPVLRQKIDDVLTQAWPENDSTENNLKWARILLGEISQHMQDLDEANEQEGQEQSQQSAMDGMAGQREGQQQSEGSGDEGDGQDSSSSSSGGGAPGESQSLRDMGISIDETKAQFGNMIHNVATSISDPYDTREIHGFNPLSPRCCRELEEQTGKTIDFNTMQTSDAMEVPNNQDICTYRKALTPEMKTTAMLITARLRAKLRSLLQSYVLNRGGSYQTGKLDTRRLARLSTCNANVFQRYTPQRDINTDIYILVDMSGSMYGAKINMTSMALYSIAAAVNGIKGVQLAAGGFTGNHVVPLIKFGDPLTDNLNLTADSGTQMGEGLMFALTQFTWSKIDRRRLVIILSDGETYNPTMMDKAVALARKLGVELAGIGIQNKALEGFLQKNEFAYLENIKELPEQMFKILNGRFMG